MWQLLFVYKLVEHYAQKDEEFYKNYAKNKNVQVFIHQGMYYLSM